jgi:hypothetical protein
MNPDIEALVWAATVLLALVTVAFIGASLLRGFLFHQRSSPPLRGTRALVTNGRVFCPAESAEIELDRCIGCPHLRRFDARGSYVICAAPSRPSRSTYRED